MFPAESTTPTARTQRCPIHLPDTSPSTSRTLPELKCAASIRSAKWWVYTATAMQCSKGYHALLPEKRMLDVVAIQVRSANHLYPVVDGLGKVQILPSKLWEHRAATDLGNLPMGQAAGYLGECPVGLGAEINRELLPAWLEVFLAVAHCSEPEGPAAERDWCTGHRTRQIGYPLEGSACGCCRFPGFQDTVYDQSGPDRIQFFS